MWVEVTPRAYLALLLWLPIGIALFASMRPIRAGVSAVVFGILLLPEIAAFDPPLVPPIDKNAIACLSCYVGMLIFARRELGRAKFLRGSELWFLVVIAANVGTSMTNPDPVIIGGGLDYDGITRTPEITLPSISSYEIFASTVRDLLSVWMPFHLGRALVRTPDDAATAFRVIAAAMLLQVLPVLIELRLSPQLHNWIYGYHASNFSGAMRGSGFKPTMFMTSGLALAMFMLSALFAAVLLRRVRQAVLGLSAGLLLPLFWGLLLVSRNVGANIYAMVAMPLLLSRRSLAAGRLAVMLCLLVIAFPALRSTQTFPTDDLVAFAAKYSIERAQSLEFRFENEDILLARANEKLWFGWGGYGRNRVYDERGKDISITDGEWIIRLGNRGVIGFAGSFGLLLWPVFAARRRLKSIPDVESARMLDALSLLCALNAIDLLPNGLFNVLPLFMAGALAGLTEELPRLPARTDSDMV
ncbi:MAG: hypothetical protein IAG13_21315 [Deltaproteobacteria bacterium]|nr:hypothetical protein [Nannocystaceae bacterium]